MSLLLRVMQAWSAVPARSRLRPSSLICTVLCTSSYIHPSSPIAPSTSINGRRPEPFILTSPFTSPKTFLPRAGKASPCPPRSFWRHRRDSRREDGIFSSHEGGQGPGRDDSFTRRTSDSARATCVQPHRHGGLENKTARRHRESTRAHILPLSGCSVDAHVEIRRAQRERRRGSRLGLLQIRDSIRSAKHR